MILLDNADGGPYTGTVPSTATQSQDAIAFLYPMAIHRVDVGYCLGGSELDQLAGFTHPTMVANSAHDIMIATVSSQRLADHLPNGQLRLFPNAALGFPIQSPPSSRSSSRSRSEA